MKRQLTKIKYKAGKVTIEYEVPRPGADPDEYAVNCADAPAPGFVAALLALTEHLAEQCELTSIPEDRITVTGVSFSRVDKADALGATITGRMTLLDSLSPLNLNSPHKFDVFPSGGDQGDERQLYTDACRIALIRLMAAAEAYLDGERAQGSLFEPSAVSGQPSVEEAAA